jgi:hypothetical protein
MRISIAAIVAAVVCLVFAPHIDAGEKTVRGKVTYFAAGTVYTSLGREQGLRDSTLLQVVSRNDTIATLKVLALSSKSSSCLVVRSSRPVAVGDEVLGKVAVAEPAVIQADAASVARSPGLGSVPTSTSSGASVSKNGDLFELHGRLGVQYITSFYEQSAFNVAQPGVVVNLHGAMRDVPLRFDMYANFRSLALGNRNPFARGAVNQSRIYGLSLSYDDGSTVASLGRIIPLPSPSIGYVDGALLQRRFGNIVIGGAAGYQPDWAMRSISTEFRKVALFAQYSSFDRMAFSMSAAYARTYYRSALDREAASLLVNSGLADNLYLYGNAELDLRKKKGEGLVLSPMLTSAYGTLYFRVMSNLTVGLGVDAARSYYSFEAIHNMPDSLLVNTLRSGMTVSLSWYLPGGVSIQESYAPRSSLAPFGQEYSNSSALSFADIFSTGVSLRGNYNINRNEFTTMAGYGLAAQATIARTVDLTVRYQDNGYTVKQTDQHMRSTSLGGDFMIFLTRSLTFMGSYDRRDDYTMTSHAVFAEFGFRF